MIFNKNIQSAIIRHIILFSLLMGIVGIVCLGSLFLMSKMGSARKMIHLLERDFQRQTNSFVNSVVKNFRSTQSLKPEIIQAIRSNTFDNIHGELKRVQVGDKLKSIAFVLGNGRIISDGHTLLLFKEIIDSERLDPTGYDSFFKKEIKSYILVEPLYEDDQLLGYFIGQMNFDPVEKILASYQHELDLLGYQNSSVFFRSSDFFTGNNLSIEHLRLLETFDEQFPLQYISPKMISQFSSKMPDEKPAFIGCLIPEQAFLDPFLQLILISSLILCLLISLLIFYLRQKLSNQFDYMRTLLEDAKEITKSNIDQCTNSKSESIEIAQYLQEQTNALEAASLTITELVANSTHVSQRSRDLLESMTKTITNSSKQLNLSRENCKHLTKLCNISEDAQRLTNAIRATSSKIDLVAINASVEAFRAGARGHDFATVTQEIESLAQSAVEQSLKVDQTITEILSGATASLEQSSLFNNKVAEIIDEMDSLKNQLTELTRETRKQSEETLEMVQILTRKDRNGLRNKSSSDHTTERNRILITQMLLLNDTLDQINSLIGDEKRIKN